MAVKSKPSGDWKKVEWISSSFKSSFESTTNNVDGSGGYERVSSPVEKKARLDDGCDELFSDVVKDDVLFKSGDRLPDVRVWTDKHKPKSLDHVIVHKKKVGEVCDFLKNVNHKNCSKILLLTGPTGCGKTCTLHTVCRDYKINVIEWVMPIDNICSSWDDNHGIETDINTKKPIGQSKKSLLRYFDEFILRACKYSSLLTSSDDGDNKKIVLIKDLPHVIVENPEVFHEIINKYCNINKTLLNQYVSPLVFVISDTNVVRDLFPDDLKCSINLTNINFNPITDNNVVKVLEKILLVEYNRLKCKNISRPSKSDLLNIAETSDGDLRSAILKLQFSLSNNRLSTDVRFKEPKPAPNFKSERIRVIKSSSKSVKQHRVCEIDKDKIIDFFNSVGRVLYPKKEYLSSSDEVQNRNFRFVHSPSAISDVFLTSPNKIINILHENYLERFTNIKDVSVAANYLSTSDLLMSSTWEAKDTTIQYALNITTRGIMLANKNPAPNTFKPISKSKIWVTENRRKDNIGSLRQIFPDIQSESDVLLDIIPYLNKLKVGLDLTHEQNDIISRISKY